LFANDNYSKEIVHLRIIGRRIKGSLYTHALPDSEWAGRELSLYRGRTIKGLGKYLSLGLRQETGWVKWSEK
jgi:hypothetical protein